MTLTRAISAEKTEGNTFTKKIGQTVYVGRYHFNEDAKETMHEKINRMLVTEASRMAVYLNYVDVIEEKI